MLMCVISLISYVEDFLKTNLFRTPEENINYVINKSSFVDHILSELFVNFILKGTQFSRV